MDVSVPILISLAAFIVGLALGNYLTQYAYDRRDVEARPLQRLRDERGRFVSRKRGTADERVG